MFHPLTGQRIRKGKIPLLNPQIDKLNLQVDSEDVQLAVEFDNISRIFFHIIWASNTPNFTLFGGVAALTNGIQIMFNDKPMLPETLKDNDDFFQYKFDTEIDQDAVATKNNILSARLSFFKFVPPFGLNMVDKSRRFFIRVQDDLTSQVVNTQVSCIVEGFITN